MNSLRTGRGVVVLALVVLFCISVRYDAHAQATIPKQKRVRVCFTLTVDLPSDVRGLVIAIPKAREWPTQRNVTYVRKDFPSQMRVTEKKIIGCEYFLFTAGKVEGGGHLTFEQVFKCDSLEFNSTTARNQGGQIDRNRLNRYLRSEKGIEVTSSRIRSLATSITRKSGSDLKNAERICRWVQTKLTYDRKPRWSVSALDVLRSRRGDCAAHSVLTAALCRAAGIPTRIVAGYQKNEMGNLHVWNECYIEGRGWIPVDSTARRFDRMPAGAVIMSKGSHLRLHHGKFMSPQVFQTYCFQFEGGEQQPEFNYTVTISDVENAK